MDGLCRLCGNERENLSNIFDDNGETEKLITNIRKILSIEIRKDDFLPITICHICTNELERITSFIDRSHEAQKHLKQLHEVILLTRDEHSHRICSSSKSDDLSLHDAEPEHDLSIIHENNRNDDNETYEPGSVELVFSDTETDSECDSIAVDSPNNIADLDQRQRRAKIVIKTKRKISRSIEIDEIDTSSSISNDSNPNKSQYLCGRITRGSLRKLALKSTKDGELDVASSKEEISTSSNRSDHSNEDGIIDTAVDSSMNKDQELRTYAEDFTTNRRISSNSTSKNFSQDFTNDTKNQQSIKKQSTLRCEKCEKNFDLFVEYEDHILELHPDDRTFSCKLCCSTFRKRTLLNVHLRTAHREKTLRCSLCDYVCGLKGRLIHHMKDVHEKNLACSQCNYRAGTKHRLTRHIRNKHTPRDKAFVCEICGKTFERRASLLAHRKSIHFPEPRQCPGCGIVFASLLEYFRHKHRCKSIHLTDKPRFECSECGTSFAMKTALIDHINTHLDIRPYMCDICGKSFFQRIRLNTHLYVHSGPQFKCNICGRGFNRKDNMKNHQKRQHSRK